MKTLVDCDLVFDVLTRGPFPPVYDSRELRTADVDVQAIEAHLLDCYECRQLAEALRPSVNLIHEALSDEERSSLPSFTDNAMMNRLHSRIIEAVFESEEDPARVRRIDRACKTWLAPATVLLPIAAVLLLMLFATNSTGVISPLSSVSRSMSRSMASLVGSDATDNRLIDNKSLAQLPAGCLVPVVWSENTKEAEADPTDHQVVSRDSNCSDCHDGITDETSPQTHEKNNECAACHMIAPNTSKSLPIDKSHYHCCTSCHAVGRHFPSIENAVAMFTAACATCHDVQN